MTRCQPESQFADAVMVFFLKKQDKSKVALESCSNRYCVRYSVLLLSFFIGYENTSALIPGWFTLFTPE